MTLEISLFVSIFISYLFAKAANRLHLSSVVGLILAGLLITMPPFSHWLIFGNEVVFMRLANVGLFTLMFLAGFEVSWNMLKKERKDAIIITTSTVLTSLGLGTAVFVILGYDIEAALIMGVCFGITAEATKARVLIQLKKLKTRVGALLMGSGIINDIIGVALLFVVTYIFTKGLSIHEAEILGGVIAAFFAGAYVHYKFDRFSSQIKIVEKILLILVVPFFFINMGIHFDIAALQLDWKILFVVILTATAGQIIGVMITKPFIKLKLKQLYLIGWGMNSKGAVELAIAYIANRVGILPNNLYSALVITALVSTIMFQVIIFRMVKKDPRVMK